jgi:dCTP deaminase
MFRDLAVADDQQFIMHPSELVLAITRERLELADDLVGRLEGRSSLARLGIIVHGTSNVFDAGWRGHPVLELGNIGRMPVALYPRMRICSFTFEELSSPAEVPYYRKPGNRFAGQTLPTARTPE